MKKHVLFYEGHVFFEWLKLSKYNINRVNFYYLGLEKIALIPNKSTLYTVITFY